ncbi:uncharacterized protein, partial [Cherax quadricarinatus]|uniref:uncharacterized protein n=1 Tax=Cherax quadricarinatus TaxID=27406 RepID=UPI00387E60CB
NSLLLDARDIQLHQLRQFHQCSSISVGDSSISVGDIQLHQAQREAFSEGQAGRSDRRRGGRRRGEDEDGDDGMVSTVTPDGVIEFDVRKLLGKNKRKDTEDEEDDERNTGMHFDSHPALRNYPSRAPSLASSTVRMLHLLILHFLLKVFFPLNMSPLPLQV